MKSPAGVVSCQYSARHPAVGSGIPPPPVRPPVNPAAPELAVAANNRPGQAAPARRGPPETLRNLPSGRGTAGDGTSAAHRPGGGDLEFGRATGGDGPAVLPGSGLGAGASGEDGCELEERAGESVHALSRRRSRRRRRHSRRPDATQFVLSSERRDSADVKLSQRRAKRPRLGRAPRGGPGRLRGRRSWRCFPRACAARSPGVRPRGGTSPGALDRLAALAAPADLYGKTCAALPWARGDRAAVRGRDAW